MLELLGFCGLAERAKDNGFMPVPVDGKQPLIRNWNSRPLGAPALNELVSSGNVQGAGMAFRTGKLIAVDIDHDDADAAERTQYLVFGALGHTSFVRVGRWPRRALFYRSLSALPSTRIGATEILGVNRLITVSGTHPTTGKAYYWPGECLLDHNLQDLPLIDAGKMDYLIHILRLGEDTKAAITMHRADAPATRAGRAIELALRDIAATRRRKKSQMMTPALTPMGERNDTLFKLLKDRAKGAALITSRHSPARR